jgi:hypothetical protein
MTVPVVVAAADRLVPRRHPNRLRHTHGTEVRRRYGLDAAQVVLGRAPGGRHSGLLTPGPDNEFDVGAVPAPDPTPRGWEIRRAAFG